MHAPLASMLGAVDRFDLALMTNKCPAMGLRGRRPLFSREGLVVDLASLRVDLVLGRRFRLLSGVAALPHRDITLRVVS